MDIVFGDFNMKIFGSKIFQGFWKAWIQVRQYIPMMGAVGGPLHYLVKDRSIWWGLSYNGKHLALIESCSAKAWDLKGISLIQDIMDGGQLREWEDIKYKFNILDSQKKTYSLIKKEMLSCNPKELLDANGFLKKIKWIDGNLLSKSTIYYQKVLPKMFISV